VFRLISNSPVEEKILSRATEKLNVSELVVESGKFNADSVETDNSMERKRMMEILLTDFDTVQPKGSEKSGSDEADDEDGEGSDASEKEDLNELLSNNEPDYQLYASMDEELEKKGGVLAPLYTNDNDIPDWVRFPPLGAAAAAAMAATSDNGARKRKAVMYDDGLTEKQFLRLMEKQAADEEKHTKKKLKAQKHAPTAASAASDEEQEGAPPASMSSALTDWTFR
jgi:ATP-dependent helicase STH1/SNF2